MQAGVSLCNPIPLCKAAWVGRICRLKRENQESSSSNLAIARDGHIQWIQICAFLTLQRTWNDRSHGRNHPLPQGLTEAHLSQLAPLLEPMGLPVEESASQRLASRLADLAAKARGTTVDDPNLLADERALVMELIDATRTPVDRQTSAWQQRIAAVKAQVGEPVWASLSPSQLHRT